jgi:hypothetical protein
MHLGGRIPPFLAQRPPSDSDDSSVPPFGKMMVFPILESSNIGYHRHHRLLNCRSGNLTEILLAKLG